MPMILKTGATLLVVLALGVGAIGCGGDDDKKSDDPAAQTENFTQCLQDAGVEPPSNNEAPTFDPSKLQKALEECRDKLPDSAPVPPQGVAPPSN